MVICYWKQRYYIESSILQVRNEELKFCHYFKGIDFEYIPLTIISNDLIHYSVLLISVK